MQKSLKEAAQTVSDYFTENYERLTEDENSYIQRILRKLQDFPVDQEKQNLSIELKHQGNTAFNDGDYIKAMEKYNNAIGVDPSNYVIYANRALTYVQLGKTQEAINECLTGIKCEPSFATFYIRLAKIYWTIDKQKSLEYVYKRLEYEPTNEILMDLKDELIPCLEKDQNRLGNDFQRDDESNYINMFKNSDLNEKAKEFFKGKTPEQVEKWMSDAMKTK